MGFDRGEPGLGILLVRVMAGAGDRDAVDVGKMTFEQIGARCELHVGLADLPPLPRMHS